MNARDTETSPDRAEYAGAVYGSLLAASVVASSAVDGTPIPAADLVTLLITTGVVFWIAHLYARVVTQEGPLTWRRLRATGRGEWPLAQSAVPPAVAAGLLSGLGVSDTVATWGALVVAVATQVGWAVAAALRTRRSPPAVLLSGIANLALGVAIVALKTLTAAH